MKMHVYTMGKPETNPDPDSSDVVYKTEVELQDCMNQDDPLLSMLTIVINRKLYEIFVDKTTGVPTLKLHDGCFSSCPGCGGGCPKHGGLIDCACCWTCGAPDLKTCTCK